MLAYLINLFWIILSVILIIIIVLLVALFVLLAMYIDIKEKEKKPEPSVKLTFDGMSYSEMCHTTARLLKQDKKITRKYRRPYFQNRVA